MCEACKADILSRFSHLHVHTDASRLDGLGTVDALVAQARVMGFPALAITDHGSLANAITFTMACEENGVKPIIGLEGYLAVDGKVNHITLIANGNEGFESLVHLNNKGQHSAYSRPAFSTDDLIKHNAGLYLLTGCIASPFQQMPLQEAVSFGKRLLPYYGGRMLVETMSVGNYKSWERSMELAAALKIPPIVTNDVHFPCQEQADLHPILTRLKAGFDYQSNHLYLASAQDILSRVIGEDKSVHDFFVRGIDNAGKLARRAVPPTFSRTSTLPHIEGAMDTLRKMCEQAIVQAPVSESMRESWRKRATYELDIIERMGYGSYFYILNDIVMNARIRGVRVGPGRGSAAGSLILYLLKVTQVNPIEYALSFERFLNPQREGMPDVDVDFDSESRETVIEYAATRWGGTGIATYSRYSHKTLVHDLCKYFRVARGVEAEAAEGGPESAAFTSLCTSTPALARAYRAFLGQIKTIGRHAGGIIITDLLIPLERSADGNSHVAAWTEGDQHQLSYAGIVKFDLLGLSALTVLKRLEQKFGRTAPDPTDNAPEFELFRTGQLEGIFQFSGSQGIINYTKRVGPTKFDDLVAINALYRPGALDAGTADHYPEWRKAPRKLHPLIDPIIEPTYGVIVYQEQVMAIVSAITGGTLADADEGRRIIVKSKVGDPHWEAEMGALLDKFVAGGKAHGLPDELVAKLWAELKAHARYSFNRAHAVSYARISWELAWWKWHHRSVFYAETINSDSSEMMRYIYSAAADGLEIVPPRINTSGLEWTADDTRIYMPLTAIRFMGEAPAAFIITERPFPSIDDFISRVPKGAVRVNVRRNLALLGSFDGMDGDLSALGKLPQMDKTKAQVEALGFPLPTKELLDKIAAITAGGWVAGIISDIERRTSKYGDYWVYRLSPSGTFWIRATEKTYERGDLVAAHVKADSGKATKHRRL